MASEASVASHDALWHLVALGVLSGSHAPLGWHPEQVKSPAKVAIIDTSVAIGHPNLRDAILDELCFDLVSTRDGAFPVRDPDCPLGALPLGDAQPVVAGLPQCKVLLDRLRVRLEPDQMPRIGTVRPATAPAFSAHGTAIAGLVGARPVRVAAAPEVFSLAQNGQLPLPYCGVDPSARLIPISTGFDSDPEQLVLAFLYAELVGADVIVLPRGIPDPFRTVPELSNRSIGGRNLGDLIAPCPVPDAQRALWAELAELIIKISLRRPVVCAAGNEFEEFGIYPANLASEDNGVIAVGAVNARGAPCCFSPASDLTVWAPSSDGERFDADEVRLDLSAQDRDPLGIPSDHGSAVFSGFQVISTDAPGKGGYTPGNPIDTDKQLQEYQSLYCRFGGTSAASAIIGGLLSLGRSLGRVPPGADGIEAKAWLLSNCAPAEPDFPNLRIPTLDGQAYRRLDLAGTP